MKTRVIKKIPKDIIIFDLLTNLAWILTDIAANILVGTSGTILKVLTSVSFIVTMIIAAVNPFIKQWLLFPAILNWEEDTEKAQRNILIYEKVLLIIPIIIAVFAPAVISIEAGLSSQINVFLSLIFITTGNLFLIASFFGSITIRKIEKWTSDIPQSEKYMTYSMTMRISLTSFFNLIAIILLVLAPFVREQSGNIVDKLLTGVIPLLLFGLIFFIINNALIIRGTERRIFKLQSAMKNLSEGNYRIECVQPDSRDQMALLQTDFNTFLKFNKIFLKDLIDAVAVSGAASEHLLSNMNETSLAVKHITGNIAVVHSRSEKQSAGVLNMQNAMERIVHNLNHLNNNIESQSTAVTESVSTIEEMTANIQSVNSISHNTVDSIKDLNTAAKEGNAAVQKAGEIVQIINERSEGLLEASTVIQNIASQTNLLAMNAAIEAAHAGDTGRGFAVVAGEIRKLAEESSAQGKTITTVLKELKNKIEMLNFSSRTVETQFVNIMQFLGLVYNRSTEIMNAMTEQSSGSIQVLDAMREITAVTEQVKQEAVEMFSSNEAVNKENEKLVIASKEIDGSMKTIGENAVKITQLISDVSAATEKERDAIRLIAQHLEKLRV